MLSVQYCTSLFNIILVYSKQVTKLLHYISHKYVLYVSMYVCAYGFGFWFGGSVDESFAVFKSLVLSFLGAIQLTPVLCVYSY